MTSERSVTIVLFGLGEAGSSIAADLVEAGVEVRAFDPAPLPTPMGLTRVDDPKDAFGGVDLVMAVTAASDAHTAMDQAWERVDPSTVYADLATASPRLKTELAGVAKAKGVPFVDVALMAPVPGRGMATPALACGSGSSRYAAIINDLGGRVEVVGEDRSCRGTEAHAQHLDQGLDRPPDRDHGAGDRPWGSRVAVGTSR